MSSHTIASIKHLESLLNDKRELVVDGNLDLGSLTTLPENTTLSAGGYLDLRSLTTLPENTTLSAGGDLYLRSLTTLPDSAEIKCVRLQCNQQLGTYRGQKLLTVDGYAMIVHKESRCGEATILQCTWFGGAKPCVVARIGDLTAHGETVREAVTDVRFKYEQATLDVSEVTARVRSTQTVTINDYRLLTGACRLGVQGFLDSHKLGEAEVLPLETVTELVRGQYGGEKFLELVGKCVG